MDLAQINGETIETLARVLRQRLGVAPHWCVVAGSGLSAVAEALDDAAMVPYAQLPGMPQAGVAGHAGQLVVGRIGKTRAAFFCGRCHVYEYGRADEALVGVRAAAQWGCRAVALTNAAGALNPRYRPGDLMLIADHIDWQQRPPAQAPSHHPLSPYAPALREAARDAALSQAIPLHEGIYAANLGPAFETPAEARMLRRLGADAVGMSTVPEALAARQVGLEVLGISYIANSLVHSAAVTHDEVLANATLATGRLARLLEAVMA